MKIYPINNQYNNMSYNKRYSPNFKRMPKLYKETKSFFNTAFNIIAFAPIAAGALFKNFMEIFFEDEDDGNPPIPPQPKIIHH